MAQLQKVACSTTYQLLGHQQRSTGKPYHQDSDWKSAWHLISQCNLSLDVVSFNSLVQCCVTFPWWKVSFWQRFGMFDCGLQWVEGWQKSNDLLYTRYMIVLDAFSNLHQVMNKMTDTLNLDAEAKASRWDCAIQVLERMMSGGKLWSFKHVWNSPGWPLT